MKRKLSLLLVIAMLLSVIAPLSLMAEGDELVPEVEPTNTTVVVHKIVMDKTKMGEHDADKKYDPKTGIENVGDFFGDTNAKDVAGVFFVAIPSSKVKPEASETVTKADAEAYFKNLKVEDYYNNKTEFPQGKTVENTGVSLKLPKPAEGKTEKWFIFEVPELSTYINDGNTLTGSKAVPVEITLPYIGENGELDKIHVYPKNTEDKPKIDKDFDKANADKPGKKETISAFIGQEKKFHVHTIIPKDAKYKTLVWKDNMSEGLTFKKDITLTTDADITLNEGTDYTVVYYVGPGRDNFTLTFTEAGLKKLEKEAAKKAITINMYYHATVNSNVKVEETDNNDVKLSYGNEHKEVGTPPEFGPGTTQILVNKSWGNGTTPEPVTFNLSKKVENGWEIVKTEVLNAGEKQLVFKGLDETATYKVEEASHNYKVIYKEGETGSVSITNEKSNNPPPLDPDEPKVVTYGKKFVKLKEGTDERLAGAEFVIKNSEGKYLRLKEDEELKKQDKAYDAANEAYKAAVVAYNANKTDKNKESVIEKKKVRDKLFKENGINYLYEWTTDITLAYTLISDEEGRFEITGLNKGTYKLEEIKAPDGYALLSGDKDFHVGEGTYKASDAEGHIQYDKAGTTNGYGLRIDNKDKTIPQTGGIGTIIFTVVGLGIMTVAVTSLKKRNSER